MRSSVTLFGTATGRDDAENTNYRGAWTATLDAAIDLYGLNSTQYTTVTAAWSAVSVS